MSKNEATNYVMEKLGQSYKQYNTRLRNECSRIGVRSSYRQIITLLAEEDGIPQLELVRLTGFKAPTISLTLLKMQEEGYITKKTDLFDQRSVRVYITDKGRAVNKMISERLKNIEAEILADFTMQELEDLNVLLNKLQNCITDV